MAFMTVKIVTLPVDNLEQLVENPRYQAGVTDGVALTNLFKVRPILIFSFRKMLFVRKAGTLHKQH